MPPIGEILRFMYAPPLRFLAWIMETWVSNRAHLKRFKEHPRIAVLIRQSAIAILLLWVLIWVFAPDQYRERLTDEFKAQMAKYNADSPEPSSPSPAQPPSAPAEKPLLQTDQAPH